MRSNASYRAAAWQSPQGTARTRCLCRVRSGKGCLQVSWRRSAGYGMGAGAPRGATAGLVVRRSRAGGGRRGRSGQRGRPSSAALEVGPARCDEVIEGLQCSHPLSEFVMDVPMGRLDASLSLRGQARPRPGLGRRPAGLGCRGSGRGPVAPWRTAPVSPFRTFILEKACFSLSRGAGSAGRAG